MVLGNITAIAQTNLKRMLAYSTIAQMGFMLLGCFLVLPVNAASLVRNAYSARCFKRSYALTSLGTSGVMLLLSRQGFEAEKSRLSRVGINAAPGMRS